MNREDEVIHHVEHRSAAVPRDRTETTAHTHITRFTQQQFVGQEVHRPLDRRDQKYAGRVIRRPMEALQSRAIFSDDYTPGVAIGVHDIAARQLQQRYAVIECNQYHAGHPQNRKYITYYNAARRAPSHGCIR